MHSNWKRQLGILSLEQIHMERTDASRYQSEISRLLLPDLCVIPYKNHSSRKTWPFITINSSDEFLRLKKLKEIFLKENKPHWVYAMDLNIENLNMWLRKYFRPLSCIISQMHSQGHIPCTDAIYQQQYYLK